MSGWLIRWFLSFVAIILTTYLVAGFEVTITGAIFGSLLLGIVNATIRPVLLLLTLPINLLTLGLFTLVINGFMLWLVGLLIRGFEIQTFWTAVFAALILMIISSLLNWLVRK